jgi:thioredoxin 1
MNSINLVFSAGMLAVVVHLAGCGNADSGRTGEPHRPSRQAAGESRGRIVALSKDNFEREVVSSPMPVLVEFWAEWCGPCKMLAPTMVELSVEYEGKVKVGKVNVDEQPAVAKRYDIRAIPTLFLFKDGKVVDRVVGLRGKKDLKATLDKVVANGSSNRSAP